MSATVSTNTKHTNNEDVGAGTKTTFSESEMYLKNLTRRYHRHTKIASDQKNITMLENVRSMSKRCASDRSCKMRYFGFWGFGNAVSRNVAINLIRFALRPRMLHASTQSTGRFEGYMILRSRITEEELSEVFDMTKLGMGFLEFDNYMDEASVSCIERVEKGWCSIGDWNSAKNRSIKLCYERKNMEYRERQRQETVLRETGQEFTTGNMLSMYYDRENLRMETTRNHGLLTMIWQQLQGIRREYQQFRNNNENRPIFQEHSDFFTTQLIHLSNTQTLLSQVLNTSYAMLPPPPQAAMPPPPPPPATNSQHTIPEMRQETNNVSPPISTVPVQVPGAPIPVRLQTSRRRFQAPRRQLMIVTETIAPRQLNPQS